MDLSEIGSEEIEPRELTVAANGLQLERRAFIAALAASALSVSGCTPPSTGGSKAENLKIGNDLQTLLKSGLSVRVLGQDAQRTLNNNSFKAEIRRGDNSSAPLAHISKIDTRYSVHFKATQEQLSTTRIFNSLQDVATFFNSEQYLPLINSSKVNSYTNH